MFHNGHISGWEDLLLNAAISSRMNLGPDPWNDSRTVALLASESFLGIGFLQLAESGKGVLSGSRFLVMDPGGVVYFGSSWNRETDGCLYSNTYWRKYSSLGFSPSTYVYSGGTTSKKEEDKKPTVYYPPLPTVSDAKTRLSKRQAKRLARERRRMALRDSAYTPESEEERLESWLQSHANDPAETRSAIEEAAGDFIDWTDEEEKELGGES